MLKFKFFVGSFGFLIFTLVLLPQSNANETALTYKDALILGAVEGIAEFLPISSTGHLIISSQILGVDKHEASVGQEGYTSKQAIDDYCIIIQLGAILAIFFLYWDKVLLMIRGVLGRSRDGLCLARNVLLAFLPAAVVGLFLHDWITDKLFQPWAVIFALILGSFFIFITEFWRKNSKDPHKGGLQMHQLKCKQCLLVGLLQCLAMWPGISRSLMAILGGYFAGLGTRQAIEFSFLLGIVTLSSASFYKALKQGSHLIQVLDLGPVLLGISVAFLLGILVVKALIRYLSNHGLGIFAWYRLILAFLAFFIFYAI